MPHLHSGTFVSLGLFGHSGLQKLELGLEVVVLQRKCSLWHIWVVKVVFVQPCPNE